ncbi:FAD-dependent oxidoreductase [Streptomyces sp. AS58]|uniref:FAD-dependent oxidoreductase n=1 Tax=Streptomyces sp. AS58 TaxID=1519489 RepID=UPI000A635EC2|nr:FAD-dependent oxidoreductase [Streptomyces sp. AS58]
MRALTDTDLLVVGAGLMGSATAWAASRRGLSVTLVEQFAADHNRGSSHGSARIVRRSYDDPTYTRLTGRAFELWRELELDSGTALLRMLGGLDFGERDYIDGVAAQFRDAGVTHEILDAGEAERRWPGLRFEGPVIHHPQAGTVDAAAAVAAFESGAARHGAVLRFETAVVEVREVPGGVRAELSDGSAVTAARAVVAAGAWLSDLLGDRVRLPELTVTEQEVFHFPRLDPDAPPWPSVVHEYGGGVYHLQGGRDGGPGDDRKIGVHYGGRPTRPDHRDRVVSPETRAAMVEYVSRWMPGCAPTPRGEATCLYTSTPSEDFLLDEVGALVVCSPCSGHGAKFAPLIGELTTGLVTGAGDVPERFRLAAHLGSAKG